jgi:hypothetical protein
LPGLKVDLESFKEEDEAHDEEDDDMKPITLLLLLPFPFDPRLTSEILVGVDILISSVGGFSLLE